MQGCTNWLLEKYIGNFCNNRLGWHKRLHIRSLVDIKNNVFLGAKREDDVKGVAEEGGPKGKGQEKKLLENNRLKRRL